MGCLESCLKHEEGEPDERTPILPNEHRPSPNSIPVHVDGLQQDGSPKGSVARSNQDEQTMLNGILTKYSADVIDVTAIDSRIDAIEYMNRVTLYNRKLAGDPFLSIAGRLEIPKQSLRSSCDSPIDVLSAAPPPFEDTAMLSEICDSMATAISQIQVTRKDGLTIDLAQS